MNIYRKADESKGNSRFVELENGEYMERMTQDSIVEYVATGYLYQVYMEAADGDIVAKPFENLGLFGAQPEPPMRFRKAVLGLVAE